MTSSDVITPGDEHREELVGLMRVAFNLGQGMLAERGAVEWDQDALVHVTSLRV